MEEGDVLEFGLGDCTFVVSNVGLSCLGIYTLYRLLVCTYYMITRAPLVPHVCALLGSGQAMCHSIRRSGACNEDVTMYLIAFASLGPYAKQSVSLLGRETRGETSGTILVKTPKLRMRKGRILRLSDPCRNCGCFLELLLWVLEI